MAVAVNKRFNSYSEIEPYHKEMKVLMKKVGVEVADFSESCVFFDGERYRVALILEAEVPE